MIATPGPSVSANLTPIVLVSKAMIVIEISIVIAGLPKIRLSLEPCTCFEPTEP
jgi:hypothetical protein